MKNNYLKIGIEALSAKTQPNGESYKFQLDSIDRLIGEDDVSWIGLMVSDGNKDVRYLLFYCDSCRADYSKYVTEGN